MAAVVESLFTAFIKTEARTDEMPFNEVDQGEHPIQTDENEYEMGPGNAIVMKPGEDVTFADPKRPAGGFPAFVEAVAVQIGASLEIPKEMLLKQFNSSYSASRAALLEFWKLVKMRREWFISDWCRPIYEVWMYEAVARGRIKAPGFFNDPIIRMAWLGADFIGPAQGMLDPTKEITAEEMMCENGFSTRSDSAIKLNGSEFIKNVASLGYENQILTKANAPQRTADLKNEYINASVGGQSET
jgi:lambda family phage portal protein